MIVLVVSTLVDENAAVVMWLTIRRPVHQLSIGPYTITALSDGLSRLPPMFFPGLDECAHDTYIDNDGTVHIPTGCFVIQSADATILVDAGLGPLTLPYPEGIPVAAGSPTPALSEGGRLPDQLQEVGCDPADIDIVFLTHLHADHVGWVAPRGRPYFENATVMFGAADWDVLIESAGDAEPGVAGMKAARAAGRIETVDSTTSTLRPGVTVEHCPGHTPGSYVVIVSSASQRLYLLGDTVQHPLQLNDSSISFLTDTDVALAHRNRGQLLRRIEDEGAAVGMDHFPTGTFQRITSGNPRMWTTAD
jgi:glyoxylase-like metal-dependent hydrolase (beta-lactamase superfamily II)